MLFQQHASDTGRGDYPNPTPPQPLPIYQDKYWILSSCEGLVGQYPKVPAVPDEQILRGLVVYWPTTAREALLHLYRICYAPPSFGIFTTKRRANKHL